MSGDEREEKELDLTSPDARGRNQSPTLATHCFGSHASGRNPLLLRYYSRNTDQEPQQITGDSNSVITLLFEETLIASDAGNIGRLLVPTKCAEDHFPSISQPEGLRLKVQDSEGSEWKFQFQFHNNKDNSNSKTYFLEVISCKRSGQLQEEYIELQVGDKVTLRLEAEGKLVMEFRKASTAPI